MKITIAADKFRTALGAVMLAASKDWWRPHMASVLFEVIAGTLRLTATTGHWLARMSAECDVTDTKGPSRMVVRTSDLALVLRAMKGGPTASISFRYNRITVGSCSVKCSQPAGVYPDVDAAIKSALSEPSKMLAVSIGPTLIADIAKSVAIAGGKRANMIIRTNSDMLSGIFITSEMAPGYEALLMPMRPTKDETLAGMMSAGAVPK